MLPIWARIAKNPASAGFFVVRQLHLFLGFRLADGAKWLLMRGLLQLFFSFPLADGVKKLLLRSLLQLSEAFL